MDTLAVKTSAQCQMLEITERIQALVRNAGIQEGWITIYNPHTTAGLAINENADPDVVHDLLRQLEEMVPHRQSFYLHAEGNSAAHVKATLVGSTLTVLIEEGRLLLGRWQGIFFCEFDGPRDRQVMVCLHRDPP